MGPNGSRMKWLRTGTRFLTPLVSFASMFVTNFRMLEKLKEKFSRPQSYRIHQFRGRAISRNFPYRPLYWLQQQTV